VLLEGKILTELLPTKFGSYGFRFQEESPETIANMWNVGWEKQTSSTYSWDGTKRKENGIFIFQYTLSGCGAIDIANNSYLVKEKQAFLVEVPGQHRYFLPTNAKSWEFIYLTLYGKEVEHVWNYMLQQLGPIIKIPTESTLIRLLFNIYQETMEQKIKDPFYASAKAYEFSMECYRFAKGLSLTKEMPLSISRAIMYMENNYNSPISLDDIALHAGLSRYYLIKQFSKTMNTTPGQYLNRIRIKKSIALLRKTDLPLKDIASQIGFDNDNYFNKVFRKMVGVAAGQFRIGKQSLPIDHIIMD